MIEQTIFVFPFVDGNLWTCHFQLSTLSFILLPFTFHLSALSFKRKFFYNKKKDLTDGSRT